MCDNKRQALDLAQGGHSFLLTGSIGTGKTTLLVEIIQGLKKAGKSVAVTASTGLASQQIIGKVYIFALLVSSYQFLILSYLIKDLGQAADSTKLTLYSLKIP